MIDLIGLEAPSLSLFEKHLLKLGFTVTDRFEPLLGRVFTVAEHERTGERLTYPHPKYVYAGVDRAAELAETLAAFAALRGQGVEALTEAMRQSLGAFPAGYACRACGACCSLRDAFQGSLAPEEVEAWRRAGREDILRLVVPREKDGCLLWRAWVNPKTGEYFKRCPWFARLPELGEGRYGCRIHDVKPLKCRAFPLNRRQAERIPCPGQAEPTADEGSDPEAGS